MSDQIHAGDETGEDSTIRNAPAPESEPADPFPDAPLFAMLRTIATEVGTDRIDQLWIFPPRRLKAGETAVAVVSAFLDPDHAGAPDDRRRVLAAHYTAPAEPGVPPRFALDEYGTAPADRIGRVVEDVVDRIEDAPPEPPRSCRIHGDPDRWDSLLHELAERVLADAASNPRIRR